MTACDAVLDSMEDAVRDELPDDAAAHAAECAACQSAVARAREQRDAGGIVAEARAPAAVRAEIKALACLAAACVTSVERMGQALDDDLADDERTALVAHLHACPRCQACWEAFATLREVGSATRPATIVRARLSLSPRYRVDVRRRSRVDLRLATAAAYLFAALTVTLVGNPASLAREGTSRVERATVYARAAVENRLSSYGRRAMESVAATGAWLGERGVAVWGAMQKMAGGGRANPDAPGAVDSNGNGG